MEFWQAFTTIKKRWYLIIAFAILATLVAGGIVLIQPKVYISSTTINTGASQKADWYATSLQLADMQAVLLSYNLLSKMDSQVHLNKPIADIAKAIKVSRVGDSGVLRLDVSWTDPQKAQQAANTLTNLFIDYQNGQLQTQAQRDEKKLEEQLVLAQQRLQRAELALQPHTTPTDDPVVKANDDELVAARNNYFNSVNQLETAKSLANNASSGNLMTIIDPALIPPNPEPDNLLRTLVFGFLMGLLLGILLAVGLEYLNTLPRLLNLLSNRLYAPILTVVPWEKHWRKNNFSTRISKGRREAYRQLGANLLVSGRPEAVGDSELVNLSAYSDQPVSILVVAEKHKAGTSSVAANLAIALSEAGQQVLLVDANLTKPTLHHFMQETAAPGLSDWLQEPQTSINDFVTPTSFPNLSFMAAGSNPALGRTFLLRRNLDGLVRTMEENFNFVIVDGPARNDNGDAFLLARAIKGIVIVIRPQGHKDEELARQAVQFAEDKLLGVVINGARVENGLATSQIARKVLALQEPFYEVPRERALTRSSMNGTRN